MANLDVALILRLVDRATAPLKAVGQSLRGLARAASELDRPADLAANTARINGYRAEAVEAAGLAYALAQAVRPAIAFEGAMADVAKVVEFDTAEGVGALGADILQLSKDIPIAAEGLADIVAAAGQAGVVDAMLPDAEQTAQLLEFTEDAARMGVAFDLSAAQAGEAMAGLRNIFRITQPEVVAVADAVNHLSNNMASAAPDILDILNRVGGLGDGFGLAEREIAALGSTFLSLKLPAEEAATTMREMFLTLQNAPDQTDRVKEALEAVGYSAEGMKAAIEDDAQGALLGLLEAISRTEDRSSVLFNLFGQEHAGKVTTLVANLDLYRQSLGLVADDTAFAGSMMREFETRSATTANALQTTSNRVNVLAITIGSTVLPALNDLLDTVAPVIEAVTQWASANPEFTSTIIQVGAGLVGLKIATLALRWVFAGWWGVLIRLTAALPAFGAVVSAAGPILAGMGGALGLVRGAVLAVGRALLLNPIGLAVAAIGLAVYVIYQNWEPIVAWFQRLWGNITTFFGGFRDFVVGVFTGDMGLAYQGIVAQWEGITGFFGTLFDGVIGVFQSAWETISGIASSIAGAAANILGLSSAVGNEPGPAAPEGFIGVQGALARGGPARAGQTYLVGEEGPELFTPGRSGFVTPNDALSIDRRPALAGAAGGTGGAAPGPITINIHPTPGMDPAAIARAVRAELAAQNRGGGDLHDGAFWGSR